MSSSDDEGCLATCQAKCCREKRDYSVTNQFNEEDAGCLAKCCDKKDSARRSNENGSCKGSCGSFCGKKPQCCSKSDGDEVRAARAARSAERFEGEPEEMSPEDKNKEVTANKRAIGIQSINILLQLLVFFWAVLPFVHFEKTVFSPAIYNLTGNAGAFFENYLDLSLFKNSVIFGAGVSIPLYLGAILFRYDENSMNVNLGVLVFSSALIIPTQLIQVFELSRGLLLAESILALPQNIKTGFCSNSSMHLAQLCECSNDNTIVTCSALRSSLFSMLGRPLLCYWAALMLCYGVQLYVYFQDKKLPRNK